MTSRLTIRHLLSIVALTTAWCGLWRSVSIANLLSGAALASALTYSGLGTSGRGGIRITPLLQLCWLVLVDLVMSTINVAIEIITPTNRTDEGIIEVTLPSEARQHLLLLVVAITLTPGTAVVDADPDTGVLYLHLLHIERRDATIEHIDTLARLTCEALPVNNIGVTT